MNYSYIKILAVWMFLGIFFLKLVPLVQAGPVGATYEIKDYGFGSGGATGVSGATYGINGVAGEQTGSGLSGTAYKTLPGLVYTELGYVPAAPTFTNPGTNYDRLLFVIIPGNNPSDTSFAVSISTDNFVSNISYVKSDGTVGTSLASTDFKTYTNWGGAGGTWITGLASNTTYYLRIKSRHGQYTDSAWGTSSSATTSNPTLTFTLSAPSITFTSLTSGNAYTDASQATTFTTSTNAYNGYTIYGKETQALTSITGTIPDYASPNTAPTSWSGTGFGYTTNDTNLGGTGGINRFATGTKYAGFQTSGSGDPMADDAGPVTSSPISNEQFTVSYRVTASNTTSAGVYSNVIQYTIVPQY